jgi:hypothetical protein
LVQVWIVISCHTLLAQGKPGGQVLGIGLQRRVAGGAVEGRVDADGTEERDPRVFAQHRRRRGAALYSRL